MTTYNTGNALGSSDARDLYDNAENIDKFANGSANTFNDRLGVSRKSIAGMENAFDAFIQSSGYTVPVAYTSGIVLSAYNQLIEYNDEFYKLKAGQAPYTTTGTWGTDSAKLVAVGDAALRQELTANANDFNLLPELANYAALRAYTGDVTAYYVRGVANIFDGGAGVFRVDAADETTADDNYFVIVDSSGRRWKREKDYLPAGAGAVATDVQSKLRETVSVKDFGAVGDGVTDDTAAIQAAEDYASANSLGVYFPSGVYLCGSVIYRKGNTDWRGDGMYQSVLKHSGGSDTHHLVYVSNLATSYDHIGFYSMGFDGNRSGSTDPNVSRIVVYLDRNSAGGVDAPSKDVRFIGCRLFNFSFGNMGLHIKGYTGVQVKDSVFEDGGSGLYHPVYLRRCADVAVTGNNSTGRDGNACLKVQASPQTVIANNICQNGARGVFVQDAQNATIVGNTVYDSTLFGIDCTIELAENSTDVTVTGNTVFNAVGGVRMSNISAFNLSGNNITGFSTDGIKCRAARDGCITGNTIITADAGGGEVRFIDFDAGPTANRVSATGNWLRNSRPSGTTYGIWTNETTVSGIYLIGNAFSGTGWTEKHLGIEPVFYADPATGVAVAYDARSFSSSLHEIHGLANIAGYPGYGAINWRDGNVAPALNLAKSRSGIVGTNASSVQSGDELGRLQFNGDHNGSFLVGARVRSLVDGTPTVGSNLLPANLVFETRSSSGSSPVIRMTINSDGRIIPVLPTSAAGLPSGALWNNAGIVSVAP